MQIGIKIALMSSSQVMAVEAGFEGGDAGRGTSQVVAPDVWGSVQSTYGSGCRAGQHRTD